MPSNSDEGAAIPSLVAYIAATAIGYSYFKRHGQLDILEPGVDARIGKLTKFLLGFGTIGGPLTLYGQAPALPEAIATKALFFAIGIPLAGMAVLPLLLAGMLLAKRW
jgi:hypothetical protein